MLLVLLCDVVSVAGGVSITAVFLSCRAMGSDKNKELFLNQVEQILEGVKQDREKVRSGCGMK